MPVKLSVIIPVHNGASWLVECLDSVLSQSLHDLEVICIDDASSDNSLSILNAYSQKDERIRVVAWRENIGSGAARNKGIDLAQGEFLAFCDADDAYLPGALAALYLKAKTSGADIAGGNVILMDKTLSCNRPLSAFLAGMCIYEDSVVRLRDYSPLWIPWFHQRFIFSSALLKGKNIRYPDFIRGQDPPFLAEAFCLAEKIIVCPDPIYLHRAPAVPKELRVSHWLGYMESINSVFNIFVSAGYIKNACLYFMFTGHHWLNRKQLMHLNPEKYQAMQHILGTLLDKVAKYKFDSDYFAPYPIWPEEILQELSALHSGRLCLAKLRTARKLSNAMKKFCKASKRLLTLPTCF